MKATRFEYRFRFILHGLIFMLGFFAPWLMADPFRNNTAATRSTWIVLAETLFRHGWLTFSTATITVLVAAIVFTALGAGFRLCGSAYVGSGVVASRDMHGNALLADGPYRRTRNPLYLGTLLFTIGLSVLMPVSGAVVCIALIWILQIRLALAEEPFLAARFGQSYVDYATRVPRFLPSLTPLVPAAGAKPQWLQSLLGELFFVGVVVVLAVWGWEYNAQPLIKGVIISLGVWIVARAFLPKPAVAEPVAP